MQHTKLSFFLTLCLKMYYEHFCMLFKNLHYFIWLHNIQIIAIFKAIYDHFLNGSPGFRILGCYSM